MKNLDTIKQKVSHLIRLSKDNAATDGEIENAVRAATRLMTKYNITRDDIDLSDEMHGTRDVKMGRHVAVSYGSRLTTWEVELTSFVCHFLGYIDVCWITSVPLYKNGLAVLNEDGVHRKGAMIYFYGADDNAEAAVGIFEELRDMVATMAIVHHGGWFRGDGAVYAQGFVAGMDEARKAGIKELVSCDEETHSLIVQDEENQLKVKKRGKEWIFKTYGWRIQGSSRGGATGSSTAYSQGKSHGKNHTPSRPKRTKKLAG